MWPTTAQHHPTCRRFAPWFQYYSRVFLSPFIHRPTKYWGEKSRQVSPSLIKRFPGLTRGQLTLSVGIVFPRGLVLFDFSTPLFETPDERLCSRHSSLRLHHAHIHAKVAFMHWGSVKGGFVLYRQSLENWKLSLSTGQLFSISSPLSTSHCAFPKRSDFYKLVS